VRTLLFVDDEPHVLQGLQRQLRPMRNEWNMHFATNSLEALDLMAMRRVDVVVSDMMMPGMDGSQLLSEVLKRHPQTVRIVLSGHSEREAVLRLVGPAHQYLSKPCNADELRQAIVRAFSLRDLLGNERLKKLTARIKSLPSLPAILDQLADELQSDTPSLERVGEIISRDIALTAKILQLVNSAFFGLPQPVDNPTEAVVYLGLNTVRSLALSLEIFAQFDRKLCPSFSLDMLTQHSWFTGAAARGIAHRERCEQKFLDQCFLAGLLHDVGQLILAFSLPAEYAEAIAESKHSGRPLWQVEHQTFGATHADVGAYLLALWGLPNPLIEAVALHHQPGRAGNGFSQALVVHVADVFAHQFSPASTEIPPQLDLSALIPAGCAEKLESWRAHCEETIQFQM
jgi:HD-like signal output (HDOD) protein/CheY-like chemotaxis protein